MFEGIRWRITWPYLLLVVGALACLGLLLAWVQRDEYVDTRRDALAAQAHLVADVAGPAVAAAAGSPNDEVDGLAKRWGQDVGARITFIAVSGPAHGIVLGD